MEGYNFSWDQLGDIEEGRPSLGKQTSVAVYRLMQYTMRAVLEKEYGDEKTRLLLVQAGRLAGEEFCKNVLDISLPFIEIVPALGVVFKVRSTLAPRVKVERKKLRI